MEFPDNLRYTKEHEWIRLEDDDSIVIGITDYAQDALGDIVYIELPGVGDDVLLKDEPFAVVESVKAVSDIYVPVSGVVVEVNDELPKTPEIVNEDCYGDGWMVRLQPSDASEVGDLLSAEDYQAFVDELS